MPSPTEPRGAADRDASPPDAFDSLDYPRLLARIAERCAIAAAAERMRAWPPAASLDEARRLALCSGAAIALCEAGTPLATRGLPDLDEPIERLRRGASATAPELLGLASLLDVVCEL